MATEITGFMINFEKLKSNFMVRLSDVIAIVKATKWQATEAHAAPFIPISGIGTKTKFKINFTITPTSQGYCWYHQFSIAL